MDNSPAAGGALVTGNKKPAPKERRTVLVAKREYTSRTKYRPHHGAKERARAAKRAALGGPA